MADNQGELAESLSRLFRCRHIAVIGAARTPGKLGHAVVRNLVRGGYAGRISAINSVGAEVEGRAGYRSLEKVPGRPDCAFIAIPAAGVLDAIGSCIETGVRFAIVGASGFAELGTPEGRIRQEQIAEAARSAGLRIVGPNTNGILDVHARLSLGYNAAHAEAFEPGVISIISHSGALFDAIARRLRQVGAGLAKFIATGNEADLTLLDFLEYLISDEATRVIGLVVEAIGDAARFRRLAIRARQAGKSLVALKVGRSALGAEATLAHSSRLAGSARAYAALLRESGVACVPTVEALAGGCALLAAHEPPGRHGWGLVCVTTSGAGGAILADRASDCAIPLAGDGTGNWSGPTADALAGIPSWARIRNPIDLGALGDWNLLAQVMSVLEANGVTGPTVAYAHIAPAPGLAEQLANTLIRRAHSCASPVLVLSPGGLTDPVEAMYARGGIPLFRDTAACFDSLQCYYAFAEPPPPAPPAETPRSANPDTAEIGRLLRAAPDAGEGPPFLSELESAEVLRRIGVPMVRSVLALSLEDAARAAAQVGYPAVLKVVEPRVAHKHRNGLVATAIRDGEALAREYDALVRSAMRLRDCAPEGVHLVVQPMVPARAELLIGASFEEGLGHFLIFGPGGIHAELYAQITLLPIPVTADQLRARVRESPAGRLLASAAAEGAGEALLQQLCSALCALQELIAEHGDLIGSIDVNPLVVDGNDCVAVDALIVRRGPQPGGRGS